MSISSLSSVFEIEQSQTNYRFCSLIQQQKLCKANSTFHILPLTSVPNTLFESQKQMFMWKRKTIHDNQASTVLNRDKTSNEIVISQQIDKLRVI